MEYYEDLQIIAISWNGIFLWIFLDRCGPFLWLVRLVNPGGLF